jgi:hypothetical protein
VEVKLPQKFLGSFLVEGRGVFRRSVTSFMVREDEGSNRLSPAAAGFLHADLEVLHCDSLFAVCAFGRMVMRTTAGSEREGMEEEEDMEE